MVHPRILTVIGTRPEVIKMAPVIQAIQRAGTFEHSLVVTAQHRELLDPFLSSFAITPDLDLNLMQSNQSLADFATRALAALSETIRARQPNAILVQGDTATVPMASLAAFYSGVSVCHVEAGLRSFHRNNPYPEEVNRRVTSCLANLHFAPTERAQNNLLNEGISPDDVFVTGNTIVDALRLMPVNGNFTYANLNRLDFAEKRVVLVTAHRRESHGAPLLSICDAIRRLARRFAGVEFVYPVHPNPHVEPVVRKELASLPNVHLLEPIPYQDMLRILRLCYLVLTDSGGVQEEAPSFNKPVLVLREVTERPELIEAGAGRLVGTSSDRIVTAASELLLDDTVYHSMQAAKNPFGDGHAAERIVRILAERLAP
ncbi:MAG: UDP-N-acetylglucosamine 2-epimerase (non-hydrolyzing) [Deltaproteobacteria bacterium]|nr:UDP-N-acetylglucosamine 2-epimerase (non-hydrolyzing) [Deltaproteobacteria bacterium]